MAKQGANEGEYEHREILHLTLEKIEENVNKKQFEKENLCVDWIISESHCKKDTNNQKADDEDLPSFQMPRENIEEIKRWRKNTSAPIIMGRKWKADKDGETIHKGNRTIWKFLQKTEWEHISFEKTNL